MKKIIVTTTINKPSEATIKFSQKKDWQLIVVGDKKTPHDLYKDINCIYIHPDQQEREYKKISDILGWNTIQRRNIGFIKAYEMGASIVATVDDDNIPYDTWGEEVFVNKEIEVDIWESKNGVFDPLSVTNNSNLWHRGYPIELLPTKNSVEYKGKQKRKILVQANLWDGDPDIDAMCRLTVKPCVKFDNIFPYASNEISPFNSQNTFISREILPYYMMLPFVGRMDDIWASYMIQKKFPNSVVYNKATVYQERNKQDLIKNLENEIIGYRNNLLLIEDKYELSENVKLAYKEYVNSFKI
jgi:hypothetical protein